MTRKVEIKSFAGYILLVLLLSTIPVVVHFFLTPDLPHTHDGLVHLPRIAAFYKALQDGQIPVRWAGDLNYGYGMPLFNFIYHLPYLVASFFLFVGFDLVSSFKLSLSLSFILSGIFMFLFAKELLGDDKKAFLLTIFYQFAPFRFVELFIRGSFGEVYTYAFLPLTLFGLARMLKKPALSSFLITALGAALLVISHNAASLVFFLAAVLFVVFFAREKKSATLAVLGLIFGLCLSSYYWIPAILEHKYTYGDLFMKDLYASHFPPLWNFFIPNLFNDKSLQTEGISVQLGLFHVLGLFGTVLVLFRGKTELLQKRILLYGFLLLLGSLFFMQPVSKFFWQHSSYLRQFQFPWRFLSISIFAASLFALSFFTFKIATNKVFLLFFSVLVVFSTIAYWKPSLGIDKIKQSYYWNFPLNTTYYGETDVIWSEGPAKKYPQNRVDIIGGKGHIENFLKKSNEQTFVIDAKTKVQLVSHTQYFPGWKAYIDGKLTEIEFQDPNWRGQITFYVPKGLHKVLLSFGESPIRAFSDFVSAAALVVFIVFIVFPKFKKA